MEVAAMDSPELRSLLKDHGWNSNAFMALYPEFELFRSKDRLRSAIAYVETKTAWVGAADPLGPLEEHGEILKQFGLAAKARGKDALLIAAGTATRQQAKLQGYGSIWIGSEPSFDFQKYQPRADTVQTARRLEQRGFRVEEVRPREMNPQDRVQLEKLLHNWLASRKMELLGFLNTVNPWILEADKKYFVLKQGSALHAFVAAIPIWPRKAWYLIDVIRPQESLPGGSELLILEAMRILKQQGAREVSLGVSPLSNLHRAPLPEHPWLYRGMSTVYRHFNVFYRFQSLHQFKLKFKPTSEEPSYLLYWPGRLSLRVPVGLIQAIFPDGIRGMLCGTFLRSLRQARLREVLASALKEHFVLRPIPLDGRSLLQRTRMTQYLLAFNLVAFLISSGGGWMPRPEWITWGSFSLKKVLAFDFLPMATAGMLHWNAWHLLANSGLLFGFVGLLEVLLGASWVLPLYFLGYFSTNLLTALLLVWPATKVFPGAAAYLSLESDVGASLAIFSCLGGLIFFLKNTRAWLILLGLGVLLACLFFQSLLQANHWVAIILGVFATGWMAKRRLG